jgi:hypothetical protein
LVEDTFGTIKNEAGKTETVRRFTLSNKNGMSVEIINYGATIVSLNVPDKTGNTEDVVLGFDNMHGRWLCSQHSQNMEVCFSLLFLYDIILWCNFIIRTSYVTSLPLRGSLFNSAL